MLLGLILAVDLFGAISGRIIANCYDYDTLANTILSCKPATDMSDNKMSSLTAIYNKITVLYDWEDEFIAFFLGLVMKGKYTSSYGTKEVVLNLFDFMFNRTKHGWKDIIGLNTLIKYTS